MKSLYQLEFREDKLPYTLILLADNAEEAFSRAKELSQGHPWTFRSLSFVCQLDTPKLLKRSIFENG